MHPAASIDVPLAHSPPLAQLESCSISWTISTKRKTGAVSLWI